MMDKYLKVSMDSEFMGLNKDMSLISIGCVTEDNKYKFYAEISDYSDEGKTKWIEENVINNLKFREYETYYMDDGDTLYYKNTFDNVSKKFISWIEGVLKQYPEYDKVMFVSDCCAYDAVHLFDLLSNKKTALDVPSYIVPYIFDINQYMLNDNIYYTLKYILSNQCYGYKNVTLDDPFDLYREHLVQILIKELDDTTRYKEYFCNAQNKHNALHDAIIINMIYNLLQRL